MSEKLLHEELDDIWLKVLKDHSLGCGVHRGVRLGAFKLMVMHILKDIGPRPAVDDVGSGLAKIAVAMADRNLIERDRNLIEQSRLTARQHDWCKKQKEAERW